MAGKRSDGALALTSVAPFGVAAPPATGAPGAGDEPVDAQSQAASRREVLHGLAAAAGSAAISPFALAATAGQAAAQSRPSRRTFKEIAAGVDGTHHVPEGYDAQVLIRWGDPIFTNGPAFDPRNQTAEAQRQQFGTNNDFIGFVRLRRRHGLLCVNHEYADPRMMFPGSSPAGGGPSAERVAIEMAAVGGTVIEVRRSPRGGGWSPMLSSRFNRRITAETPMRIDGPAAGHPRLRTKADLTGTRVLGTLACCAGGITPWNTWLIGEENFHLYFSAQSEPKAELAEFWKRYGLGGANSRSSWSRFVERFDLDKEPNESNRFGWVVEVDPLDPRSTPVKHTALGRIHREGAETTLAKDGRVVVYSGDDKAFECVYKFVSRGRYSFWNSRRTNKQLLSSGTLYVAKLNADNTGEWVPLVHGQGPLASSKAFSSQADVLVDTRLAARVAGGTPLDRPEDVEPGPDGRVIVACSHNADRKPGDTTPGSLGGPNKHGHIIEIIEANGDHGATRFRWSILVKCGPRDQGGTWQSATTDNGWFSCPDNVAFDPFGSLWVSTDQGSGWPALTGRADGLYALGYRSERRGRSRLFFRAPVGAEVTGPRFTPEGDTLFLSVQHPGADGAKAWPAFGKDASADDAPTRWPARKEETGMPPRPAIVAITRKGGGPIGT
jgi:secreted PhoX family phosphatase